MPRQNPFFSGREKELRALRDALTAGGSAAVTQAISGLGGVGKTSLAIEYANVYREHYDALLFTRADSTTALIAGYKAIAEQLELPQASSDDFNVVVQAVGKYLDTAKPSRDGIIPYLLIVDNADFGTALKPDDLKTFLPDRATGHVLLTTRSQTLHGSLGVPANRVLTLPVMPETEAIRFLIERVYGEGATIEDAEATATSLLAEELGYLPLALEQSGAYVAQQNVTFRNYLNMYRKLSIEMLERNPPEAGDYDKTVATTWQISFDEVEKECPAAADLMRVCAFVAPDAIPFELVVATAASKEVESLATFFGALQDSDMIEDNYKRLLAPLMHYSLAIPGDAVVTFNIHRLVQTVTRWQLQDEREKWTARVVNILNLAFPDVEYENWTQCERLTVHIQSIAEWMKHIQYRTVSASSLQNKAAVYLYHRARYLEAEPLYDEALAINREALPKGHPSIANSLNNLAGLYNSQGRYAEAEPLFDEALAINREALPKGHPSIANSLNNLAGLYNFQGRYAEAEPLFDEALAINREALPKGHPDIANSLNNLALFYNSQGRYAEAEPLLGEALVINREALPDGHPSISQSLNNLALLYNSQGRYVEAEPLFDEALAKRREALPDGHPSISQSLNNLAGLYRIRGRYAEAEPLFDEALAINREALPKGHPDIANSLNNLAGLYNSQGRYAEAEPLLGEALAIRREALPDGHPDIANSLNSLAEVYRTRGRYAEAEPLFDEALAKRREALPDGHPSIANSLNNLALLYNSQGRYAEAEPLFDKALAIRREALPKGHPSIANSLNNLAMLYNSQGRYAEAEPLFGEALAINREALPDGHPDIANSLNNLAGLYNSQGRYAEVESPLIQALDIFKSSLGQDHPDTKIVAQSLKVFRQQQAQREKLKKERFNWVLGGHS